jgi:hypothetical protein
MKQKYIAADGSNVYHVTPKYYDENLGKSLCGNVHYIKSWSKWANSRTPVPLLLDAAPPNRRLCKKCEMLLMGDMT